MLPPLVQPPSISQKISQILDKTQVLFIQHKYEEARESLFIAYALFQTEDALMDYYKSYFYSFNGLLLIKMLLYQQYGQNKPQNIAKTAVTALIDAVDVTQKLSTADKVYPRLLLGFLFFCLKKYEYALRFFKQAEVLAISTEGSSSTISGICSFNTACIALLGLNTKVALQNGVDRIIYEKQYPDIVGFSKIQEAMSGTDLEQLGFQSLENCNMLNSDIEYQEVQTLLNDFDNGCRNQQSYYSLLNEFQRIYELFSQTVGQQHQYTTETGKAITTCNICAELYGRCLDNEYELETGILEQIHRQPDEIEQALYQFAKKYQKIPQRPLYVPLKKAKKAKKAPAKK